MKLRNQGTGEAGIFDPGTDLDVARLATIREIGGANQRHMFVDHATLGMWDLA